MERKGGGKKGRRGRTGGKGTKGKEKGGRRRRGEEEREGKGRLALGSLLPARCQRVHVNGEL